MEKNRMAEIKRMMGLSARFFMRESNVRIDSEEGARSVQWQSDRLSHVLIVQADHRQADARLVQRIIESPVLSSLTEALLSMASRR